VWKAGKARIDSLLHSLGFENIVEPTIDASIDREGWETFLGPVSYVEKNDLQALHSLCFDIRRWTAQEQRFAAVFFPEIGHDPWRDLPGRKYSSWDQRGHALEVLQDTWLGEIVGELERDGALERTIIVVTADHRLRWLPAPEQHVQFVSPGKLDDVVFRVPLLLYAPGVLKQPLTLEWPTSHLDVGPTILDLLGVTCGRELEEGTTIFDPNIRGRRLFFWMDPYGATGLFEGGSYFMRSSSGTILKSDSLHFPDSSTLAFTSGEALAARQALAEQGGLQTALLLHLLDGHSEPY
jgi:arylsulfatase A-like enzyme